MLPRCRRRLHHCPVDAVLPALVGRDEELEALLRAEALPASLLVAGEAGIGKTSLCLAAIELARERGFETLTARPAEAEAELSLASVGDLLEPVLDRVLGELPAPQARALRVALLVDEGEAAPDARALGVAFLGALPAGAPARGLGHAARSCPIVRVKSLGRSSAWARSYAAITSSVADD